MRLNQFTDYALRALMLAALPDDAGRGGGGAGSLRVVTAADVAERFGISRAHVAKVLQRLTRLGHLEARRGRGGGVTLARAPERIVIGEVVRATEGGFGLVECLPPATGRCRLAPACRLKGVIGEARDAFLAVLDRYTLADLVRDGERLATAFGVGWSDVGDEDGSGNPAAVATESEARR